MTDKKLHPAWWMLVGCCVLQGGTLGLVQNCTGIFYAPVCEGLGFASGDFTFYKTLLGIASCLVLPFAGKILERFDTRVILSVATLFYGGATIFMGTFDSLVPFYIAGVVQGFAGAFLLFVPAPLIINHWFCKKTGFAIGVSGAITGVVGVIMNPVGSAFIVTHGWRAGYFLFGAICLVTVLPVTLFLLRMRPEDCGVQPYGYEENEKKAAGGPAGGFTMKQVFKSPSFYIMVAFMLVAGYGTGGYQVLSSYAVSLGYSSLVGASLISAAMAANIISKLSLGAINDRFGTKIAMISALVLVTAGYGLVLVRDISVLYAASFLIGVSMAVGSVVFSWMSRSMFGAKEYATVLSIASMFNTALGAVAVSGNSAIYDAFGDYRPAWVLNLVLSAAALLIAPVMFAQNKRDRSRMGIEE